MVVNNDKTIVVNHSACCPACFPPRVGIDSIDKYSRTPLRRRLPEIDPRDMRACELEVYNNLPDEFVVYRGYASFRRINTDKLLDARSWTLSRWTAITFVNSHTTLLQRQVPYTKGVKIKSKLVERLITKDMVLAVCLRGQEQEIVLKKIN